MISKRAWETYPNTYRAREMNILAKTLTKIAGVIALSLFLLNLGLKGGSYEI